MTLIQQKPSTFPLSSKLLKVLKISLTVGAAFSVSACDAEPESLSTSFDPTDIQESTPDPHLIEQVVQNQEFADQLAILSEYGEEIDIDGALFRSSENIDAFEIEFPIVSSSKDSEQTYYQAVLFESSQGSETVSLIMTDSEVEPLPSNSSFRKSCAPWSWTKKHKHCKKRLGCGFIWGDATYRHYKGKRKCSHAGETWWEDGTKDVYLHCGC